MRNKTKEAVKRLVSQGEWKANDKIIWQRFFWIKNVLLKAQAYKTQDLYSQFQLLRADYKIQV